MHLLGQELQFSELQKEFFLARVIKLNGGFTAVGSWLHFGYGARTKAFMQHPYSRGQI